MRTLSPWPWLVIAALAGCGQVVAKPDGGGDGPVGPVVDDGMRSGTRLKLQWLDFGGTRVASGQLDTMRDEVCYPQAWADGRTYCQPSNTASVVYADPACTQRLGLEYTGGTCPSPPPDYLIEYAPDNCGTYPTRLYERGAVSAAAQHYNLQADGTCAGPTSDPNYRYYAAGAAVPTSALVELTESTDAGATRYSQRFYESADGARLLARVHDSVLDTDCYLQAADNAATTGTCGPSDAYYSSYYQDPSCSQPKLDTGDACPAPQFGVTYPQTATCPGAYLPTYYPVGAVADSTLFRNDGAGCTSQTPDPTRDYYALGPALALPQVPRSRDTVAGRRVQLTHYHDGDTALRDYSIYDQDLDTACYPFQLPDDTAVCIPFQNSVGSYFTDAGCTMPLDVIEQYRGDTTCAMPPAPTYAVKYIPPVTGCDYTYEVHTAGARLTSPLFTGDPTSCAPFASDQYVLYRAGPVVPYSDLATATRVTDP